MPIFFTASASDRKQLQRVCAEAGKVDLVVSRLKLPLADADDYNVFRLMNRVAERKKGDESAPMIVMTEADGKTVSKARSNAGKSRSIELLDANVSAAGLLTRVQCKLGVEPSPSSFVSL